MIIDHSAMEMSTNVSVSLTINLPAHLIAKPVSKEITESQQETTRRAYGVEPTSMHMVCGLLITIDWDDIHVHEAALILHNHQRLLCGEPPNRRHIVELVIPYDVEMQFAGDQPSGITTDQWHCDLMTKHYGRPVSRVEWRQIDEELRGLAIVETDQGTAMLLKLKHDDVTVITPADQAVRELRFQAAKRRRAA